MKPVLLLAIALVFFAARLVQGQVDQVEPFINGERVLFLGDSITRAGGWHSIISLYYETRFPEQRVTWLNAGISGDTATGALKRLKWDVLDRNPSRVVIMFGINDVNISQYDGDATPEKAELRERSIRRYEESMRQLVRELTAAHIKVILCTPTPYDEGGIFKAKAQPGANAAVSRCAEIVRLIAAESKLPVVEFNTPMNTMLTDFQKTNPAFHLTEDRIHPNESGSVVMAYQFLKANGAEGAISETTTDQLSFTLPARALPLPFEGRSREALHLVPFMEEFNREIVRITGLADGRYQLSIDHTEAGTWTSEDLEEGVNLAGVRATPQYRQALELKKSHDERHLTAALGPRMIAFTKSLILEPQGIDERDSAAVEAALRKLIDDPAAKDNPVLGSGSYAQSMAKKYLEFKPIEAKIAAQIEAAGEAVYRLNRPHAHQVSVEPLAHPLPVEERKAAFDARRDAKQIAALAEDFLSMIILEESALRLAGLGDRPLLFEVSKLYHNKSQVAALDAYRDYLLDKLRHPTRVGLPAMPDPLVQAAQSKQREATLARAEELMQGRVAPGFPPMQPGEVCLPLAKGTTTGAKNPWSPDTFEPLALAYLRTGEQRYSEQYFAYMDDWAMHEFSDENIKGTDISDADSSAASRIRSFYGILSAIAQMTPVRNSAVPADSLARILRKLIRLYPPLGVVYFDSNPQNWTPGGTATLMEAAGLMDEFKAAEYLFTRARHRHENYGVIQSFPDGSETESALWYNAHYFAGAKQALDLSQAIRNAASRPHWEEAVTKASWEREQHQKIIGRARYFLQMLTPQGEYPIGNRSDNRKLPDWMSMPLAKYAIDSGATDLGMLLKTVKGDTAEGVPPFTMTGFPYCGSFVMRSGWGEKSDYAHFYASPYPTAGHALRGLKNNNGFYLSIAGQDLLVGGGFGAYSYERSPLRVDGKEQFYNAGIGNPGLNKNHKGFGAAYIDPVSPPWRSHSGPAFDFVEGEYSGPFGDFVNDHEDNKDYRAGFLAEKAAQAITGVSHQRQVFFLKESGLWIIVDRLKSARPHEYTLDWRLPLEPAVSSPRSKYKKGTFTEENVKADVALQTIGTDAAGLPNLTLHHFGPKMVFSKTREDGERLQGNYTSHYKLYDFLRISGSWQSSGDDLMISLVEPRRKDSVPLAKVEPLGDGQTTRGFKAITSTGQTVAFLAAIHGRAPLSLGDASIEGEILIVAGEHGIALGLEETDRTPMADFAFTSPAFHQPVPIYRPIDPVRISPERNVIAGRQEIALSCSTPGVEIRYTLDGSEPTPDSTLYTGLFSIDANATLKARALRPGLTQIPLTLNGTMVSTTRTVIFALEEPMAALPDKESVKPGLLAEYAEGDWKDLVFFPERIEPKKREKVRFLFDRCEPQTDRAFSWTYHGFIKVPEDGVYTFHAPPQMTTSTQEPGYALRLFVAQREWYPATSRHAYGTWSIALKKGMHPLKAIYTDYRADAVQRLNHPGLRHNSIWDGKVPEILLSGPGLESQPIPQSFFYH